MAEDLKEFRDRREGKVTPKTLGEGLNSWINSGDIETLIYVVRTRNGEILTGYSHDANVAYVGMLEIAKQEIIEQEF